MCQLTPWSTVFLEKLIVAQLVKIFSASDRTRSFITMFIRARHCIVSWASWLQCTPSNYSFKANFNIVIPSTSSSPM